MDVLAISALVVSVITALSGFIAGMHIRKSECMGNKCLCDNSSKSPNISTNNSTTSIKSPNDNHIELHTKDDNSNQDYNSINV